MSLHLKDASFCFPVQRSLVIKGGIEILYMFIYIRASDGKLEISPRHTTANVTIICPFAIVLVGKVLQTIPSSTKTLQHQQC